MATGSWEIAANPTTYPVTERLRGMTDNLPRELDAQRLPDHRDRLFRAACAMCASREDAEDLVQETYSRVLRRPRFLSHDDDLGYLMKVLRHTWINSYRARQRQPQTVLLDETVHYIADPGGDPGVTVPEMRGIYALVYELSEPLRDTLISVDILGLSYKQAAKALGTKPGTVMSRLHRARSAVADELRRTEGLDGITGVS
jgi:RNA polymerase sigma-70 factor (ECF subfamily)